MPPNPALQPKDCAPILGQPVITPPADDIPPQDLAARDSVNLLHALPSRSSSFLLLGPSALRSSGVTRLLGYYGFC